MMYIQLVAMHVYSYHVQEARMQAQEKTKNERK